MRKDGIASFVLLVRGIWVCGVVGNVDGFGDGVEGRCTLTRKTIDWDCWIWIVA